MTASMTEIESIELEELIPYEDNNDPNHRTHYINEADNTHIWQPGMSAKDIVDTARITGQEVTALCGKVWVPKANPENYDVCEACVKIAEQIMREDG